MKIVTKILIGECHLLTVTCYMLTVTYLLPVTFCLLPEYLFFWASNCRKSVTFYLLIVTSVS